MISAGNKKFFWISGIAAAVLILILWNLPLIRPNRNALPAAVAWEGIMNGALDVFDANGNVAGWSINNNDNSQSIVVRFYLNAPYNQGGTLVGSVTANQPRPDLNTVGMVGNHGYTFTLPGQYFDGQSHALYAYAVAPDGSLFHLSTSPKTATPQGTPPPTVNLSINGSTNLTARSGDILNYSWSSNGAISVYSTFTQDSSSCGYTGTGPFDDMGAVSTSGTDSQQVTKCWIGHTYTMIFTATDAQGRKVSATATITVPSQTPSFTGSLDGFYSSGYAGGWALNSNDQAQQVTVKFYLNAPYNQGGMLVGSAVANQSRPDLNTAGIVGNHGYTFYIPSQYLDGQPHSLYAYAAASDGSLTNLPSSPPTKQVTLPCSPSSSACTPLPIQSNDGLIKVETVGNTETVFKHSVDSCALEDLPDGMAHAFRDASGNVNLHAPGGNPSNYRSVGPTLDTVQRSCPSPIMNSARNPDYDTATYLEWPVGTYTLDGNTVYSIVHNEWYPTLANPSCVWGWVNSITLVVSYDGGAHFTHPADYKIRIPAVPWDFSNDAFVCTNPFPNDSKYGSFEATNIIKKDIYYYAMFYYRKDPTRVPLPNIVEGNCLMRTQDLTRGSSWQVWTASGWGPALTTPDCGYVSEQVLNGAYIKSISYNNYLHSYLGLVTSFLDENHVGAVGYTLSQDLINWTRPVLFLQNLYVGRGLQVAYPAILDPSDTSRNFEMSGQTPYVYLMRWTGSGYDRDLVRQQVRFTTLAAPAACAWNGSTIASGVSVLAYQASSVPVGQSCVSESRLCNNGALSGTYTFATCSPAAAASCTLDGVTVQNGQSGNFYNAQTVTAPAVCTSASRTCTNGNLGGDVSFHFGTCSVQVPLPAFINGDRVQTTDTVNVRATPSTSGTILGTQLGGALGTILDGATNAAGYLWWRVNWDTGVDGWSVQDYLQKAGAGAGSCTLEGVSVASGSSRNFFAAPTVPYGSTCVSESRSCVNGAFINGSYQYATCTPGVAAPPTASFTINGLRNIALHVGDIVSYLWNSANAISAQATFTQDSASCGLSGTGPFTFFSNHQPDTLGGTESEPVTDCWAGHTYVITYTASDSQGRSASDSATVAVSALNSCTWNGSAVASGQSVTAWQLPSVPFGSTCTSQSRVCSNGTLSGTYTNPTCVVAGAVACTFNGQTVANGQSTTAYLTSSVAYGSICASQTRTCTNGVLGGTYTYGACTVTAPLSCSFNGATVAHGASVTAYQTSSVSYGQSCSAVSQTRSCQNGTLSGSYTAASCRVAQAAACSWDGKSVAHGVSVTAYQTSSVPTGQSCTSQSRTCADSALSGSYQYASCVVTASGCTPNWSCAAWNECSSSGTQSRSCSDVNTCGATAGKPAESQSCTPSSSGGGGGGGGGGIGLGTGPGDTPQPVTATSTIPQTNDSFIAALTRQVNDSLRYLRHS